MTDFYLITILVIALATFGLLFLVAIKLRNWIWHMREVIIRLRGEVRSLETASKEAQGRFVQAVAEANLESVNATCLTPLALKFPVFLGGWSIDSFLGRWLVQHVHAHRPKCVVELGSGSSTILIAKTRALLNETGVTHFAVDHEAHYLGITRELAMLNGVADGISFLHCPLVHYDTHGKQWYEGLAEKLHGHKIDLLLVDGPPGSLQPMSRHPALPELHALLADKCTVVLDDAVRGEEQEIARDWASAFPGFDLVFQREGHGLAILTRRA